MTEAATRTPFVGQTVHYQSYGTPGGEYLPEPRAAIITEATLVADTAEILRRDWVMVGTHPDSITACATHGGERIAREETPTTHRVSLAVLNPTGVHFNQGPDGRGIPFAETPTPGHWNYMPRTEAGDAVNTLVDEVCRISGWSGETVKGV